MPPQKPIKALKPSPMSDFASAILRRLGIDSTPRPTPLPQTSQMQVDVNAPMPSKETPFPPNMLDIILGNKTDRPSGTYINPAQRGFNQIDLPKEYSPEIQRRLFGIDPMGPFSWEKKRLDDVLAMIKGDYPSTKAMVNSGVYINPDFRDSNVAGGYNASRDQIEVSPNQWKTETLLSTLIHELTHASQRGNFPDIKSYNKAWEDKRDIDLKAYKENPYSAAYERYKTSPKELQAFEVERQLKARLKGMK
jgi:hypothetical protein